MQQDANTATTPGAVDTAGQEAQTSSNPAAENQGQHSFPNPFSDVASASAETTARKLCVIAYIMMMCTPFLWFLPIGVVIMSYIARGNADEMVKTHYGNIIKTFWRSFWLTIAALIAYSVLFVFMFSGVGFGSTLLVSAGMLGLTVWVYYRMIKGLIQLNKNQPWA